MFSSIGWGEILLIAVIAFLIIGPERLPGVIKELKAVRLAIKNAVGEARKQLDGEFGDEIKNLTTPIKEVAEPIQQLSSLKGMTAKSLVTKALLDGDSSDLDAAEAALNKPLTTMATKTPKRVLQDFFDSPAAAPTTPQAQPASPAGVAAPSGQVQSSVTPAAAQSQPATPAAAQSQPATSAAAQAQPATPTVAQAQATTSEGLAQVQPATSGAEAQATPSRAVAPAAQPQPAASPNGLTQPAASNPQTAAGTPQDIYEDVI